MLLLRKACQDTTAHGLPRLVTGKPVFIRVVWLLLFLFFLCLFLRGLVGFVVKLQSRQVTSSLQAGEARFQFPDVYACFENPVSGTYSANMNDSTIEQLNTRLNETSIWLELLAKNSMIQNISTKTETQISAEVEQIKRKYSQFYISSLPYSLLVDTIAQRPEQSVLYSGVMKINEMGVLVDSAVDYNSFYHATQLRCYRWSADISPVLRTLESRNSLIVTLFIDDYDGTSIPKLNGKSVVSPVYAYYEPPNGSSAMWRRVPVSDWSLKAANRLKQDRKAGIRVFLMTPGEYPSDFGSSFLLAPGKHHVVEVTMQEELRSSDQFDCLSNPNQVQFLNTYDWTPYKHEYSYSYCYFDEYNKNSVLVSSFLAPDIPLNWNAREAQSYFNLTGRPRITLTGSSSSNQVNFDDLASAACKSRERCSRLIYGTRISSATWPTTSSLEGFLSATVTKARNEAAGRGLSVPGLDYLVNASLGNSSVPAAAVAFARANLLKLEIRPSRMDCDRLKFSIDYGFENFVADIGGIMGIYLGMSLLTICELFDLIAELLYLKQCASRERKSRKVTNSTSQENPSDEPPPMRTDCYETTQSAAN